jgi:AcrR family transcriptional regulator
MSEFGSVWTRPQRSRKREQPALSREQIVAAALELLDADGIEALSMRKLGTKLNAGATSMYSHVANKDELIELVTDEVYGEIPLPGGVAGEGWRTATAQWAQAQRGVYLRHPWIVSVLGQMGLNYLGPNMLRFSDATLGVLEDAGFSLLDAEQGTNLVNCFVIGAATAEASWLNAVASNGGNEQELVEAMMPAVKVAVEGFPRLRRLYEVQKDQDVFLGREGNFEHGLRCILDSLEARLTQR